MGKINKNTIKRIAITGPECSGKTTLTTDLANYYNTLWVPEFARNYLSSISRKYTYDDVELIAKKQIESEELMLTDANQLLFCDTDLLVIKIWMYVRFNKWPNWIIEKLSSKQYDFHLLCKPDIPWIPDPLRENPYDRDPLFNLYKSTLEELNLPYMVIEGVGSERLDKAKQALIHLVL